MNKYGIATLLENYDVGYEFSHDNIPLHLTHVDSFQIELGADELASLMSISLVSQSPFVIKATRDKFYGPKKDIPVTEIESSPKLLNLHLIIMKMLRDNNAVLKNPQFQDDGYSPHVSAYDTRRIYPGDEILVDNLIIASTTSDADNAMTRILAKITL